MVQMFLMTSCIKFKNMLSTLRVSEVCELRICKPCLLFVKKLFSGNLYQQVLSITYFRLDIGDQLRRGYGVEYQPDYHLGSLGAVPTSVDTRRSALFEVGLIFIKPLH